ncbi:unnamed protein product [Diabrotica balteata]|uniref:Uncharacterized protein n=1 Tax=Diabrotica balteata TaxID=107213 RepID=A0A9N9T5Q3_DIABA|nr:unnamed protein product [Diabrotica balteata]
MEYTPSPIECFKKDLIYLYQPEEGHSQTDLEQALLTASSSLERTDRARGTLSIPSIHEELIVPRTTLEEQPKLSVTSSPKGRDRGPSEELMMIDASPRKKARRQLIPDEPRPSDKTQEAPRYGIHLLLISRIISQQRIVDLVTKFNFDEGFPTIEDLSEKPLNRLNVARCFNDLLVLSATKYLSLVPEDDCIELKYIEKGPKFIN